jgi:acetoacetate decarboxylase
MKQCDVRKRAFAMPLTSLTLGLGKVVHDYLKHPTNRR